MFDVKEFLSKYAANVTIRERDDYTIVTPPFFHIESSESIAIRFSETEDGRPIITDCGTTRDYLEIMYINLNDYKEKLQEIKERFYIEDDDGAFVMTMPTDSFNSVCKHVGYFLQAISIIANIDLFK